MEQIKIQRAEIPHDVLITSVGVNSGVGKSTRMLQMAGSVPFHHLQKRKGDTRAAATPLATKEDNEEE